MDQHVIEGYRLSPQQRELFFTRSPATRVAQIALCIDGPLDVEQLIGALRAVAARHEILRTRFQHVAGMGLALQVVAPEPRIDVDHRAPAQPVDLAALLDEARRAPFDLASDAPLRCRLIAVAPERHVLIVRRRCAPMNGGASIVGRPSWLHRDYEIATSFVVKTDGCGAQ